MKAETGNWKAEVLADGHQRDAGPHHAATRYSREYQFALYQQRGMVERSVEIF